MHNSPFFLTLQMYYQKCLILHNAHKLFLSTSVNVICYGDHIVPLSLCVVVREEVKGHQEEGRIELHEACYVTPCNLSPELYQTAAKECVTINRHYIMMISLLTACAQILLCMASTQAPLSSSLGAIM